MKLHVHNQGKWGLPPFSVPFSVSGGKIESAAMMSIVFAVFGFAGGLFTGKAFGIHQ